MKRKILVLELWGIGDLLLSTTLIQKAVEAGEEVHLLGKRHSAPLLEPTFPGIRFYLFHAGWTKFRHKYHLWQWHWRTFFTFLWQLRKERYDVAVSARDDPRDHLLMALIGARARVGFPHRGSGLFLTHRVVRTHGQDQHKVEDWRDLGTAMGFSGMASAQPRLSPPAYRSARVDALFATIEKPVFALHAGARIGVRRWPEPYFKDLIGRLRREFDFHLVLIPDPDGYGSQLASLADTVCRDLSLAELTDVIGRAHLLLCNDSAPAHLAAACGRPAIALFGPTKPEWFRPWGTHHKIILRDICRYRPCFDYCHFAEPYCMTKLVPEEIWPEAREHIFHLVRLGVLPSGVLGPALEASRLEPAAPKPPFVVAIIATYRRSSDLARLLQSLKAASTPLAVLVVDNGDDPATEAVVEAARRDAMEILRLVPGENLGCGGGLAYGERFAKEHFAGRVTHYWLSDDDVEAAPGSLERLVEAMREEGAALACPMITWPDNTIGWFPGLLEAPEFDAIRKLRVRTPEQYLAQFGPRPIRFSWATGACLLVTREALEEQGLHRTDFLIRGEDFEFSLRITAQKKGIYVPDTHVTHYCYSGPLTPEAVVAERRKQVAMLHNTAYISCRLPHGRRILRCLPGNLWRHVKNWGPGGIWEGLKAYWRGGVQGRPAGALPEKKLLVFAHTPPPHHGQSFMVQLMLEHLGGDARASSAHPQREIACFHVNSRVSSGMDDIGAMRCSKLWLLLRYCMEAIWCRFRYGVRTFYYVPAPGKRFALYRDWVVMFLCRPFFPCLIFHWHASGLGGWLEQNGCAVERWITHALLGRPALSIALAEASSRDAHWLHSRRIAIVPNGIPDPCPEFASCLLGLRKARTEERKQQSATFRLPEQEPPVFRVLYMAHCTREKGLFDALEGIALFNSRRLHWRIQFTVAGAFMDAQEEGAFRERIARPDLVGAVTYVGFAAGEKKKSLFEVSDCLCFPTYYPAESFPLTLVEAAAYGLPSVATRWRAIPEIQPPDYPGFVDPKAPAQIADALECLAVADLAEPLRARFLSHFSEASHSRQLKEALLGAGIQG